MASTSCVKCGNTHFEMKQTSVAGSRYKCIFVQCSSCGGAIAVQEYHNTNQLIIDLAKKLGVHNLV